MGFRVNIEVRAEKLDRAIRAVAKATGKGMVEAVDFAAAEFALQAGRAMPPNGGGMGIPIPDRVRRLVEWQGDYFEPGTNVRPRRYRVYFRPGKSGRWVDYTDKGKASRARVIKRRGIGKAQFWVAYQGIKKMRPAGAWAMPQAWRDAYQQTTVRRGRDVFTPFAHIRSTVKAAEGYRPFAEVVGLRRAAWRLGQMAKRIGEQQRKAFK